MHKVKFWLRRIWRQLRNRCVICNFKLKYNCTTSTLCPHCIYPEMCHWCGKRLNFGKLYGLTKEAMLPALNKTGGRV